MRDMDKVYQDEDEIEEQLRLIREALKIPGARVQGRSVIRRLPNGETTVESIPSFLDKFPGRI